MKLQKIGYIVKYPGCIMDEIQPAYDLLKDDTQLDVIDLEEAAGITDSDFIIIPGGSCDSAIVNEDLHRLLRAVREKSGFLAGICNGALVLASAGVLEGEKCTHTAVPKYAPFPEFKELLEIADKLFAGSEYVDEDVVVSNNIVTAKPHVPKEFASEIKLQLGL